MAIVENKRIMFDRISAKIFAKEYAKFSGEEVKLTAGKYDEQDCFVVTAESEDMLNHFIELVRTGDIKRVW